MATRLTPRKSGAEEPAAQKAPPGEKAAANGPAASAGARPAIAARKKSLPAAAIRALAELEAGALNRYADADEMFRELGHERGRGEATPSPGKAASAIG